MNREAFSQTKRPTDHRKRPRLMHLASNTKNTNKSFHSVIWNVTSLAVITRTILNLNSAYIPETVVYISTKSRGLLEIYNMMTIVVQSYC